LLGTTKNGKAILLKLNYTDYTLKLETEINLGIGNCYNAAFNQKGTIAVVVILGSQYGIIEFKKNESNPE
jgi:hypothetical protein